MTENVGWATLDVIPSFKGFQRELERGTVGPTTSVGRRVGQRFGDTAGKQAGSRFSSQFSAGLKGIVAPVAGIALGAGVVDFFRDATTEAREAAQVSRVTAKLIETTGQSANLTADQIGSLSERLMEYAAIDDEVIQAGANVMLTFRNVRDAAGEGNDVFSRAAKAALDLSAVLGSDMSSSALQLGKALNDPLKGVTALTRAGVQFTEQQKAQIKALVQSGDLLEAQKIILAEVEGQVGGAAGAAADGTKRMSVAIGNLKEAFGTELLPVVEGFSNFMVDDAIPTIEDGGAALKDLVVFVDGLPGPVKAAGAAWIGYAAAQKLGLGTAVAGGFRTLQSGLDSTRVRTMLAGDAWRAYRANADGAAASNGRLGASFAAVRSGAAGAGGAVTRGLSGALGLVGGTWGAAFIGGTAILTSFWQEHERAKSRLEEFRSTLDAETGAVTENSQAWAARRLQDLGLLDRAESLGLSTQDVTAALLGEVDALRRLEDAAREVQGASGDFALSLNVDDTQLGNLEHNAELQQFINSLQREAAVLAPLVDDQRQLGRATADTADANSRAAGAMSSYAAEADEAAGAVRKLLAAENKRRESNLQERRDRVALLDQFAAARQELREGAKTLDENTRAGRANLTALFDLAEQWNNSSAKVRNARGAYDEMRQKFIDLADQMNGPNGTRESAAKLARELLQLPRNKAINIKTPGMQEAIADAQRLRSALTLKQVNIQTQIRGGNEAFASGGLIGGYGSGTSDSNLIWASRGEFMQRKAAVDYYGVEFMRKLNALQIPRFAQGGLVAAQPRTERPAVRGGVNVHIDTVVAHDYDDFMRQMQRRKALAAVGGE